MTHKLVFLVLEKELLNLSEVAHRASKNNGIRHLIVAEVVAQSMNV